MCYSITCELRGDVCVNCTIDATNARGRALLQLFCRNHKVTEGMENAIGREKRITSHVVMKQEETQAKIRRADGADVSELLFP